MDAYELTKKLKGEICRGRCRARVEGRIIVIGKLDGDEMTLTEDGRNLVRFLGKKLAAAGRRGKAAVKQAAAKVDIKMPEAKGPDMLEQSEE